MTVTGLSAGTDYPYTVTSDAVSASGSLRTAALPGQTFSFAAIGDFGGGSPGETQNAANIAGAGTQFIQTLGDNIYPSAGLPDPNFTTTYSDFDARFFKPFGPAVQSQAFFPANGNKEYYGDGEFWAAFPMPGANHSWYSYDWGDAHILVLDGEQPYAPGSAQYSFAQADLAAHQARRLADRRESPAAVQLDLGQFQLQGGAAISGAAVPGRARQPRALGQQPQLRAHRAPDRRRPRRQRRHHVHRLRRRRQRLQRLRRLTQPWTRLPRVQLLRVHQDHGDADHPDGGCHPLRHQRGLRHHHHPEPATGGPPAGPVAASPAAPVVTPVDDHPRTVSKTVKDARGASCRK